MENILVRNYPKGLLKLINNISLQSFFNIIIATYQQ